MNDIEKTTNDENLDGLENKESVEASLVSSHVATQQEVFKFNWDKHFLPVSILMAAVLISGSIIYVNENKNTAAANNPTGKVALAQVTGDDDPVLGNRNAPVAIIEFGDYQCPYCRVFWKDTLPSIKREYIDTGKVRFVYRDFPLSFHPGAQPAAEATECAQEQGKFWELHDKIFEEQQKLGQGTVQFTKDDVVKWASGTGLNMNQFNDCLNSGKYKNEIQKDLSDGQAAGATGTPAFFINGRLVSGALPYANFKSIIEEELNKK